MLLKRNVISGTTIRSLTTYKRWEIDTFSPNLESLKQSECSDPPVVDSASKILVEVKAASINPIDVLISQGYGHSLFRLARFAIDSVSADKMTYDKFPMVLGRDFSGSVIAKGVSVTKFKIGDKVWGVIPPYINTGSHANLVVACADHVSLKPNNLSDVEAASVPYAGLTAYSAISCFGGVNEGNGFNKSVLVLGGSGGVGLLAIQILKSWGAIVTTTCNKNAVEWLKQESGADRVIDYDSNEVSQLTDSFDLVINAASGGKRIIEGTRECLRKGFGSRYVTLTSPLLKNYDKLGYICGTIQTLRDVSCDIMSGFKDPRQEMRLKDPRQIRLNGLKDPRQIRLNGLKDPRQIRWGYFIPNGLALNHIRILVEEGRVRPVVQNTIDFNDARTGYLKVMDGHARGKTVIKM